MPYSGTSPERLTRPLVHHVIPACRHADGTISWSSVLDLWRMVSEDSDQLSPGLLAIHRLNDLCDLHKTLKGPMSTAVDQPDAAHELLKVALLR